MRERWGLSPRQEVSPVLEERLCFTATMTGSYEAAAQVAEKWGGSAQDATIHTHVRRAGARAQALENARVERALSPATRAVVVAEAKARLCREKFSLVIQMDGWMVRERGAQWGLKPREKPAQRVDWREMKTGIVFRLEDRARKASGRPLLVKKTYVAWRGDPHEFGRRLYAQSLREGLHQAHRVYVVADGAVWIWNLVQDRFATAVGVLDWYHASQHLWAVARAIHGEDEGSARRFVAPLLSRLKANQADRVIHRLEDLLKPRAGLTEPARSVVQTELQYLERHREHVAYPEVAREGCPKGSGAVESACSQLQNRFKRTGQFWTLPGQRHLLALDLARRNEDWDQIWELAA